MPRTPAQIEASKTNGSLSRGPVSDQGKQIARRNSMTHGLTGLGIVLPNEDAEALEARLAGFEAVFQPKDEAELELVKRFALMAIRLDRCARQEAKAVALKMRHAASAYDDSRMAEVDHLISWIAHEPVTNHRRLMRTPEGISRLIAQIEALRSDLMRQPSYRWDYQHCDQLHHAMGIRREEMPVSRARALTEAIHGKFENIDPSEIPESETMAKRRWALGQMVNLVDDEIARLKTLLATFDPSALELDRAEAADRAMFDASKEGVLARKYEAACERAMYKALKELRAMQSESAQVETEEAPESDPAETLGSFSPTPAAEEDTEVMIDPTTPIDASLAVRRRPDLDKLARQGRKRSKTA